MIVGYFDGACEPRNPGGLATGGWVVPELGIRDCKAYCAGQDATNNVAEYSAAIDCLRAIYMSGNLGHVELRGDSQLVVRQFSGQYQCRSERLSPLLTNLKFGATFFRRVDLVWIPREENSAADEMSRVAFDRHRHEYGL
jgi:ribonuclease HI